jgi:maltose O-acetyltransferase
MASLAYLIKNRVKYPIDSFLFYKVWVKRIFLLPELIRRNRRRLLLNSWGALIHPTAEIGEAQIVGKKEFLQIDEFTFIGKVEIALHDKVIIGKNVCINDGVKLLSASHDTSDPEWRHIKAPIILKDYCWVATNAIILHGVEIGYGAVVGAGSVVSKSVPDFGIVIGNPAQVIQKKRTQILDYNPCEFLATNNAWLKG